MTYTADDDAWGLHDSWVMHVEDGVDSDGADFPVSITMAAAPYCQELVDGRPGPIPTAAEDRQARGDLQGDLLGALPGHDPRARQARPRERLAELLGHARGPRSGPRRRAQAVHYVLVARDSAGNRSKARRGTLKR
jgi:hypothetical protein